MTAGERDAPEGLAVRRAAAALLDGVTGQRRAMSDLLADPAFAALPPADRARAQRLALLCLRQMPRCDAVLAPHLAALPPLRVRNLLRLCVAEMLAAEAPAHGAVNAAVALMREASPRHAGLANAVLRKAAGFEGFARLPVPRLPGWLRDRLVAAYGKAAVGRMEAAHLAGAPVDVTPRDPAEASDWAARLGATLLPTGSLRLPPGAAISELPGYAAGAWWVQDAAAALPVRLLAPVAGEAVLDLCAAPGGKTLQLAAAGARVTAVDLSAERMRRVAENLGRTGLAAEMVVADVLDWAPPAPPAAILLDAPCTATGTIRRHPDLPHLRAPGDVAVLAALQARLIDRAVGMLAPGGRMVFCTCSLLPEEGERQATAALERHPALAVERPENLAGVEPDWTTREGGLRLRPDFRAAQGGMDGFYMVRFRLRG